MDRKKIVHVLDAPYSVLQWPQVSQDDQDVILELLCGLLSPLGQHRKTHVKPSKGKRRKARNQSSKDPSAVDVDIPPVLELANHVDVGLAVISKNMEMLCPGRTAARVKPKRYAAVFVIRGGHPSAFHCHFPQQIALASHAQPHEQAVRLVGFSKACGDRLSAALGVPRVSSVAITSNAPQARALLDYVREHVPVVHVAWLEQVRSSGFLETRITAVETSVGNKRQKLA